MPDTEQPGQRFHKSSRREFLATSVASTAVYFGCQPDPEPAKTPPAKSGWIDAHTHLWTQDTEQFPIASWVKSSEFKPQSFTAEEYLAVARPAGVERAILVQHSPYYGYDAGYLLDCCRRYPKVFSLIGRIDERLPELASRLRRLREQGLRGLRIAPTIHGDRTPVLDPPNWLKADEMRLLWNQATEQNIAICPILAPEFFASLDAMCQEFAQVTCVIDHLGQVDLQKEQQIESLLRLSRHPKLYIKVSAFYKFGTRRPPYLELGPLIQRLVKEFGAARLMWGSDCPYQLQDGNTYADSVALLAERLDSLTDTDRQLILRDVAAKVFFR